MKGVNMSSSIILVYVVLILIWSYSLVSDMSDKFENKNEKVFWIIGILFIPPLALFYLFKKKFWKEILIKREKVKNFSLLLMII